MARRTARSLQYAALPYRRNNGAVEVLLVTSRDTGRWVIPKGWPAKGLPPHDSAAREAMEEGGLVGQVDASSIGTYRYLKRLADGSAVRCVVEVFALEVEAQLPTWPEKDQRQTRWFDIGAAADAVNEPSLAALIRTIGGR